MYGIMRVASRGQGAGRHSRAGAQEASLIMLSTTRPGGRMKQIRSWLVLFVAAATVSCSEIIEPAPPQVPADVAEFVSALPKLRSATTVFAFPEQGFLLFSAFYGEPQDCPAGCFYAEAWGIKYAGRIGWIEGAPATEVRYDVRPTDQF